MILKGLLVVVVILALLPLAAMLWPTPLTLDDVRDAFVAHGLTVEEYTNIALPELEAVEHVTMRVEGARVNVYRYDDRGRLAKNFEYQKTDEGEALATLRQQLGAAAPTTFTSAARNGKLMMTATSENKVLNQRLADIFRSL